MTLDPALGPANPDAKKMMESLVGRRIVGADFAVVSGGILNIHLDDGSMIHPYLISLKEEPTHEQE